MLDRLIEKCAVPLCDCEPPGDTDGNRRRLLDPAELPVRRAGVRPISCTPLLYFEIHSQEPPLPLVSPGRLTLMRRRRPISRSWLLYKV